MRYLFLLLAICIMPVGMVTAQSEDEAETAPPAVMLPSAFMLDGFTYHAQGWNNCGPATLTMGLSYFGYTDNQNRAANWLKPNYEDKNVSPDQMVSFVNNEVPELPVYALKRYGGDIERLKTLIYSGFPVLIEAGYDPERANQGWMGHYLLVIGWDDVDGTLYTLDSYDGQDGNPLSYSYEHINEHWQHFNYVYVTLYESGAEPMLLDLLGADADIEDNYMNAFNKARDEATVNNDDAFAWFNMGSMLVEMAMYDDAVIAFDYARNLGLPWRMLWYQFAPYEAYYEVGRYDDMIELARTIIDNSGGYVEEAYYYAGVARAGMGETDRAIANFNTVLNFNPNFDDARLWLNTLQNDG